MRVRVRARVCVYSYACMRTWSLLFVFQDYRFGGHHPTPTARVLHRRSVIFLRLLRISGCVFEPRIFLTFLTAEAWREQQLCAETARTNRFSRVVYPV